MANPRKFADKLDIIRRKEEEFNAAFDKIMREVSDARMGGPTSPHLQPQNHWIRPANDYMKISKYKGGSLPNVNLSPNPLDLRNNFTGMNEMYGQAQHGYMAQGVNQMRRNNMEPPSGPIFPSKNKPRSYTVTTPYRNNMLQQPAVIAEQDNASSMWRRTFSDSAIQQSLQQPPRKKNQEGASVNQNNGSRIIQTPNHQMKTNELPSYQSPPSLPFQFNDSQSKSHMNTQANTSSLPDLSILSNLSIPSPIQTPIDVEQESSNKSNQQEQPNPFQVPLRVAPRHNIGKQVYPRQMASNPDLLDTLHREKLQLFSNMNLDKNDISISSSGAPLSPVTPPPYYPAWAPMSPLATGELMQQVNAPPTDLQQQLQQFQIQTDSGNTNGMGNPPPYPFMSENNGYNNYYTNNSSFANKQNICRINSGPTQYNVCNSSKSLCDRQLDSALMKMKSQNGNELSEADLNSVRVALDPLDFADVQMLSGDNTEIVDQSAEEQFRLERAAYQ